VKPLSFHPPRLLEALKRSGYAHVAADTDEALLAEFCRENDLSISDPACYTVTLRPKVAVAETEEEKIARFEKLRLATHAKCIKNAVKKKEKESKL
jgi:hypothetical protein